jgi:Ca2+-binding RTX toxin-like protein
MGEAAATVFMLAGDDRLYIDVSDAIVDGGDGYDRAFVSGTIDLADVGLTNVERVFGSSGVDVIDGSGIAGNYLIAGNGDDDILTGGSGNNALVGGAGADRFYGSLGNDSLNIDVFDTVVDGGDGFDIITVVGTIDLATVGLNSIERVYGSAGADVIDASSTNDMSVVGNGGDDELIAGSGNNWLYGNSGADRMFGNGGNDSFRIDTDDIVVDGGIGFDVTFSIGVIDLGTLGFVDIERSYGGNQGDTLDASGISYGLDLYARGGDDILIGGIGNNTLDGGAEADQFFGGLGNGSFRIDVNDTVVDGGGGLDVASMSGAMNFASVGMVDIDRIYGATGADAMDASGIDTALRLYGLAGTDTLIGGSANDLLYGGTQTDSFVMITGWGDDRIIDFENGLEAIDMTGAGISAGNFNVITSGADAIVDFGTTDSITFDNMAGLIDINDFDF